MLQPSRRRSGRHARSGPGSTTRSSWRRRGKSWKSRGLRRIGDELLWRRRGGRSWRRTRSDTCRPATASVIESHFVSWTLVCLWPKARHEAVMRRTLDRSQRAKQKPNRWSWGGPLQPSFPSAAAGTFTLSSRVHWCFPMSEMKRRLCASIVLFSDSLPFIVTADPALPLHLSLPPTSRSRFCRVGFPLSTRPCWAGAHAECFQSLPQIRNDLPMWILWTSYIADQC